MEYRGVREGLIGAVVSPAFAPSSGRGELDAGFRPPMVPFGDIGLGQSIPASLALTPLDARM